MSYLHFSDGNDRKRVYGRIDYATRFNPKVVIGVEGAAFTDSNPASFAAVRPPGTLPPAGYWNPERYAEGRIFAGIYHDRDDWDAYARVAYGVSRETEMIDYDDLQRIAEEHKPKLLVCGASAYPRIIDFKRISAIAQSIGARMFADIAHIAGPIVAGLHPSPVPYADYVTTTTHKTLRGPRGGLILCKAEHAKEIDSICVTPTR